MKDSYYTPPHLAEHLLRYVRKQNIATVADFCVGDGVLLRAAQKRWKKVKCYGTDISKNAIIFAKTHHSDWKLGKSDFLNPKSRNRCKALNTLKNGFDLVLLNPPFSCMGGTRHRIMLDNESFEASTAMAFVVESIKYLSKGGCLFAILPNSVAYSQKDAKLWNKLVKDYKLCIIDEPTTKYFDNCSPRIILVSVNANISSPLQREFKQLKVKTTSLSIFRGKVGMHTVKNRLLNGNYLVHSTNLRGNNIVNVKHKIKCKISEISGPAVLIPRVGLPNPQKICTISRGTTFILSDCVIAIKTKSDKDSNELKSSIIDNWDDLNVLYKGTGARYITIERLKFFLGLKESS